MRDNCVLTLYIHFQRRVKCDMNVYILQVHSVLRRAMRGKDGYVPYLFYVHE